MLEGIQRKEQAVLRLNIVGSVSLTQEAALRQSLANVREVFASFQIIDDQLLVVPDDSDFSRLGLSGFVEAAARQLREKLVTEAVEERRTARDALALLARLTGGLR